MACAKARGYAGPGTRNPASLFISPPKTRNTYCVPGASYAQGLLFEPSVWASSDRQPWVLGRGTVVPGGPLLPGHSLGLCCFSEAAMFSHAKHNRAFLAPANSQENGFQISIPVGFQQHPNGFATSPAALAVQDHRCQDKGWPRNAFLLPEQVKGSVD